MYLVAQGCGIHAGSDRVISDRRALQPARISQVSNRRRLYAGARRADASSKRKATGCAVIVVVGAGCAVVVDTVIVNRRAGDRCRKRLIGCKELRAVDGVGRGSADPSGGDVL